MNLVAGEDQVGQPQHPRRDTELSRRHLVWAGAAEVRPIDPTISESMRVRRPNFLSDAHTGAKGNAAAGDHRNQKQSPYPVFPRKDQGEAAGTPRIFSEVHLLPRRAEGESPHMGGGSLIPPSAPSRYMDLLHALHRTHPLRGFERARIGVEAVRHVGHVEEWAQLPSDRNFDRGLHRLKDCRDNSSQCRRPPRWDRWECNKCCTRRFPRGKACAATGLQSSQ